MSIAKNAIYNVLGSVAPLAVSVVTVPLYLHTIGIERYGVLALCWALLGYMGFLNLGLGPSVAQKLAQLREAPRAEREEVFWTSLWISVAMGAAAAVALYALASFYFLKIESLPIGLSAEVNRAKGWLAVIIPVEMLSSVFLGALQGQERFLAMNMITSSVSLVMSVAPLLVAYAFDPDLSNLLAASLGVRIASLLILFLMCRNAVPVREVRGFNPRLVRNLLSFGGWVSASSMIAPLLVTIDRFVIGAMLGAAAVSVYTVPYTLVSRIQIVPTSLSGVLFPRFAVLEAEHRERLEAESVTILAVIMTPISLFIMAILGPFLVLWIGRALALQSAPVGYLILFGFLANSVARVPCAKLLGAGRPDLMTKIYLAEVPPYLGLLALGCWEFGVVGAAAAWCIRTVADAIIFLTFVGDRKAMLKILVFPFLLSALALIITLSTPIESTFRAVGIATIALASLPWSLWNMPQSLRSLLRSIPRQLLPRREHTSGQGAGSAK